MKYYLILESTGNFPGSPDKERVEITEKEYFDLWDVWGKKV